MCSIAASQIEKQMGRQTNYTEQLHKMYSMDNGRVQGPAGWEKLPLFWFILFLSYKCTRRCKYCYAFNQVGDDNAVEMDANTFSKLLDWIPELWRQNKTKVNAVGFLGGEPLLRTDRIKRVMDAVFRHTDGMQGFIFTNGDLVDSVNWDHLEAIQWISTNITDLPIGELARRMDIVRKRSNVINQTVVATLDDENLERTLDITRFGIENNYHLRYYRNLYKGLDRSYKRRLLQKYHEICDLLEQALVRGYDVQTTFLFDTLIPAWDSEVSPYHCGKRIATVYPDGSIGPCLRNHREKTGTIYDSDPMQKLQCERFHYDVNVPDVPDECRQCESHKSCQGGCPHDKMVLTGTTCGKSVVCDIHKEIIPRLKHLEQTKRERGIRT